MRWSLLALILAGCVTYEWHKQAEVKSTTIHKVESPLAPEFCTAFLGTPAVACAVWIPNRCVIVVRPNTHEDVAHESTHCLGWNH